MREEAEFRPIEHTPDWPEPDKRLLESELLPAPLLPLRDILCEPLAEWVEGAAEATGAPPDYVLGALLAIAGATIGNNRWVSPWKGWEEPPILWVMCIGLPSAGKSPAIDAALAPLRSAERPLRKAAEAELKKWQEKAEVARIAEKNWKKQVDAAVKKGEPAPERPQECDPGSAPLLPRLVINDATTERLGAILAAQPRGTLQMRDELAGWLSGMERYSGSGTDRPFWLEAYGGRGYTVERMSREPLTIERLSIGVLGGIQPDRLKSLLFESDDDGLLARFLPIWPEPAPVRRPQKHADDTFMEVVLNQLLTLKPVTDETGAIRPMFVHFSEDARNLMDEFRIAVREWESASEGLMLSFTGKLPGMTARLALVLAFLERAAREADAPNIIGADDFRRAAHLVESYLLPMARRAYADASAPKTDRSAKRLVAILREKGCRQFSSREISRMGRKDLGSAMELNPVLSRLEEGDIIRPAAGPDQPQGGRPPRRFDVNPAIFGDQP